VSSAFGALSLAGVRLGAKVKQDDQAYAPEGWTPGDDRIDVTFARLRTELGRHLFTVKRPVSDVRTCIEHECIVSDRSAMHSAILLMGLRPTVRIVKTRRSGRFGEFAICLDEVEGLGSFVEIEVCTDIEEDHDELRSRLELLARRMGLFGEPCVATYDALIAEKEAALPLAA
jgi:adenylate cyclase class 2